MVDKYKDEETIFNAAIQLKSRDERDAYLAEACSGDNRLRAGVEALLKAHEAKSLLDEPVFDSDVTLDDSPLTEGPGTVIGNYKLLEQIGEGGMAVVYMAEQKKPLRRKVALKIIKLGMDTKQVIARFETERQALAIMNHPNIARVLDAGATETGRPYFVMELVKGICITEYCDKNKLTTKERLVLFISVCNAVQHAHQKGIIHRDIKPSNVMVTLHDGTPVPKVIDFGIAKATNQQLTEKTVFTRYAQMIGTPAYMSPEQAEFSGLDIDTRTDIYSLGVLLYELLTAATPFSEEKLREAGYLEMQRIIREEEPVKPSTKLSTLGDTLTDVAEHRKTEPGLLTKLVRGDLDWIVMKSLEKDRTRRYETANELVRDIERHFGDEPVTAGPPSTVYRLRKFVRRHRTAVLSGLLVAMALVIGLALAMVGFVQASHERDRAVLAETEAITQRDTAEQAREEEAQQRQRASVNFAMARDAVGEMTRVAKEQLADTPATKQVRRELLQKAQVFYSGFAEQNRGDPAVSKEISLAYKHVGDIHCELGNVAQAREAFVKTIELLERLAAEFPDEPEYRVELAGCWGAHAYTYIWTDQKQEHVAGRRRVVALWEELVAEFPTVPEYLKWLAIVHTDLGNALKMAVGWAPENVDFMKESEMHHRSALAISEKLAREFPNVPKDVGMLAHCHHWLGAFLLNTGQLEEAEEHLRETLSFREQLLAEDPDSPLRRGDWARIKFYIAYLLVEQGKPEEAEKEYREAIAICEKLLAEFPSHIEHRRSLGSLLDWLSTLLRERGRVQKAEDILREAIFHWEKLTADCPDMSNFRLSLCDSLAWLGNILSKTGQLEEALESYEEAALNYAKAAELYPDIDDLPYYYALLQLYIGDVEGYRNTCEKMYERFSESKKPEDVLWICVLAPDTFEDLTQSVKLAEQLLDSDEKNEQYLRTTFGAVLYRSGRFEEAVQQLSKLATAWDSGKELPTSTLPAYTWYFLAMAHYQLGNVDESLKYYNKAVKQAEQEIADNPSWWHQLALELFSAEAAELLGIPEKSVEKEVVPEGKE